jgi:hypothetical protein
LPFGTPAESPDREHLREALVAQRARIDLDPAIGGEGADCHGSGDWRTTSGARIGGTTLMKS